MSNPISNIIRSATRRPDDKLNILSTVFHGAFENMIAKTGFNFYATASSTKNRWDLQTYSKPPNYHLILDRFKKTPEYLDIDLVFCSRKQEDFQASAKTAIELHVPLMFVEQCLPSPQFSKQDIYNISKEVGEYLTVYPSQVIKDAWKTDGLVIPYAVEQNTITIPKDIDLLIPCQLNPTDYLLVKDLLEQFVGYNVVITGDNPGLSKPAYSFQDFMKLFARAKIVLSLPTTLHFPFEIMYAVANHCAIMSVLTEVVGPILTENNCRPYAKMETLVKDAKQLMDSPTDIEELAKQAERLLEYFDAKTNIEQWKAAFLSATSNPTYLT